MRLHPDSPCTASVQPDDDGGVRVAVRIPTYSGGVELSITVERSNDGDWLVFLPMWPAEDQLADQPVRAVAWDGNDYDVAGGIAYVGAPDAPVDASWSTH